ncbi:MAG: cytochrome c oxidase assembly protein [Candidatus Nanopelagicales bacterium]
MESWVPGEDLWTVDLFVTLNLLILAVLYAAGVRVITRRGLTWSPWRSVSFAIGIALLALAYIGPFETLAHTYFAAHMGQHLIVMMLAAPFIVLSCPVALAVLATSGATRAAIIRSLRSRIGLFLVNPVFTWLFFVIVLIGSHVTPVMEWVLTDHDAMAYVERPLYLISALLFYYPLIGNDMCARRPRPAHRLLSLGLMMIPETARGAVIFLAPVTLYPAYVASTTAVGDDPLVDQQLAGALMWALAMVIDSIWMMVAAVEWWRAEERKTAIMERREAREAVQ